jgi:hypothetical protein
MTTSPSTESTRRRSALAAATIAMMSIGLAACSGASNQPVAGSHSVQPAATSAPAALAGQTGIGTGHPCALLTQSDVAGSIGEPVSAGVASSAHGTGLCAYSSVSGSIAGGLLVVSSWSKLINAAHAAKLRQTQVSGIGDQAWSVFSQTGAGYPAIVVRKGAIGFEVAIHGPKILALPDRGLAKEEALATLILSRL